MQHLFGGGKQPNFFIFRLVALRPATEPPGCSLLGQTRQGLQRVVNSLEKAGYVSFKTNIHHQRSQLIQICNDGLKLLKKLDYEQRVMMERFAEGLSLEQLNRFVAALRRLSSEVEKKRRPAGASSRRR